MLLMMSLLLAHTLFAPVQATPVELVTPRYAALAQALTKADFVAVSEMYLVQSSLQVRGPSGQDRVSGQESIAGLWRSATKGAARFDFTVTTAALADDAISDRGTFVFKAKDGKVLSRGTFAGVWRREGPIWKIARHEVTVEPPR